MKVKGQIALVLVTLVDCLVTKHDLFTTVFWSNVQNISTVIYSCALVCFKHTHN